jgi:hypothetical protein
MWACEGGSRGPHPPRRAPPLAAGGGPSDRGARGPLRRGGPRGRRAGRRHPQPLVRSGRRGRGPGDHAARQGPAGAAPGAARGAAARGERGSAAQVTRPPVCATTCSRRQKRSPEAGCVCSLSCSPATRLRVPRRLGSHGTRVRPCRSSHARLLACSSELLAAYAARHPHRHLATSLLAFAASARLGARYVYGE